MKKHFKLIFSAFCLALFFFGGLYFVLAAPKEATFSEQENRYLKAFPNLGLAIKTGTLDRETEEYFLDNFPKRNQLISLSHHFKDIMSFSSYEEYLKTVQNEKDNLTGDIEDDDLDDIIGSLLLTPSPKPTSTPSATPTATATPEPTEEPRNTPTDIPGVTSTPSPSPSPTLSPTPTPSPTPAEYPPIVAKPAVDINSFPQSMNLCMVANDTVTIFDSYSRNNVLAYTSVLNKYAALLPENGKLITTVSFFSTRVNQFINTPNKKFLKCDPIDFINAFGADNVFAVDSGAILSEPLKNGAYAYYRTDAHWTSLGAYLTYQELVKLAGKTPCDYDRDVKRHFEEGFLGTLYRDAPSEQLRKNVDILNVCEPIYPCEVRRINGKDSYTVMPFLHWNAPSNDRYCVNLGGPSGPWIYVDVDNDQTENCLMITDSTGLSIIPYMASNYKQIHYFDARYYDCNTVGYTLSEMIEKYNITDIYVVVSEIHSFNSTFIIKTTNNSY